MFRFCCRGNSNGFGGGRSLSGGGSVALLNASSPLAQASVCAKIKKIHQSVYVATQFAGSFDPFP